MVALTMALTLKFDFRGERCFFYELWQKSTEKNDGIVNISRKPQLALRYFLDA